MESSNDLRNEIANARADAEVQLDLVRDGASLTLMVTLDERPKQPGRMGFSDPEPPAPELGFNVQELTREMAQRLGYEDVNSGVVITEVEPDSAASAVGLRAGMMIVEMDRNNIRSLEDFRSVANRVSLSEGVLLLVRTVQGSQYIFLQSQQ